jgi:hypothetical protein
VPADSGRPCASKETTKADPRPRLLSARSNPWGEIREFWSPWGKGEWAIGTEITPVPRLVSGFDEGCSTGKDPPQGWSGRQAMAGSSGSLGLAGWTEWVGGTLGRWKGAWKGRPSGEARNVWVRAPSFWWREPVRGPGVGGAPARTGKVQSQREPGRALTGPPDRSMFSGCLLEKPSNTLLQTKDLDLPVPSGPHSARKGSVADTVPDAHPQVQ